MRTSPYDFTQFDDGRGQYPARVSANVPRSLRARLIEAAERENISVTEYVRRALAASISTTDHREARP